MREGAPSTGGAAGRDGRHRQEWGVRGMPFYEFHCKKCDRTFGVNLSIKEREEGKIACPTCGSKKVEPLLAPFFAKTSKKS